MPCNLTVSVSSRLLVLLLENHIDAASYILALAEQLFSNTWGVLLVVKTAVQVDNHVAELTVRETLDFAARVLGVGHKEGAWLCMLALLLLAFMMLHIFSALPSTSQWFRSGHEAIQHMTWWATQNTCGCCGSGRRQRGCLATLTQTPS